MFLGFFAWYAGLARGGVAKIGQVQLAQPVLTLAGRRCCSGEEVGAATIAAALAVLAERGGHSAHAGRVRRGRPPEGTAVSLGSVAKVSEAAALDRLDLLAQGKVRDIYAVGEDRLLLVASDRISTYDVVHPTPIPDKGKVLTGLSAFWFDRTGDICPNHVVSFTEVPEEVRGRGVLVEKLEMVPVECVVRGYITGSGWKDYQRTGAVCGIELPGGPAGVRAAARSRSSPPPPRPRWATTTRTWTSTARPRSWATGRCSRSCAGSRSRSTRTRPSTRASAGSSWPTPSSSSAAAPMARSCWATRCSRPTRRASGPPTATSPGKGQPSFDKQYVRDWASGSGWDKTPPAPPLPDDVIARTRELYVDAYERITGEPFSAWLERSGA